MAETTDTYPTSTTNHDLTLSVEDGGWTGKPGHVCPHCGRAWPSKGSLGSHRWQCALKQAANSETEPEET